MLKKLIKKTKLLTKLVAKIEEKFGKQNYFVINCKMKYYLQKKDLFLLKNGN